MHVCPQINSTVVTYVGPVKTVKATFVSITEVRCTVAAGFSYTATVSNDGVHYNVTSMQQYLVFNPDCMSCDIEAGVCVKRVCDVFSQQNLKVCLYSVKILISVFSKWHFHVNPRPSHFSDVIQYVSTMF